MAEIQFLYFYTFRLAKISKILIPLVICFPELNLHLPKFVCFITIFLFVFWALPLNILSRKKVK